MSGSTDDIIALLKTLTKTVSELKQTVSDNHESLEVKIENLAGAAMTNKDKGTRKTASKASAGGDDKARSKKPGINHRFNGYVSGTNEGRNFFIHLLEGTDKAVWPFEGMKDAISEYESTHKKSTKGKNMEQTVRLKAAIAWSIIKQSKDQERFIRNILDKYDDDKAKKDDSAEPEDKVEDKILERLGNIIGNNKESKESKEGKEEDEDEDEDDDEEKKKPKPKPKKDKSEKSTKKAAAKPAPKKVVNKEKGTASDSEVSSSSED
uniref:Uncharacterized protein n=1 Tax=viral metagenome TaxID=1070528 RepID=A0A6C0LI74_9ZZZZ